MAGIDKKPFYTLPRGYTPPEVNLTVRRNDNPVFTAEEETGRRYGGPAQGMQGRMLYRENFMRGELDPGNQFIDDRYLDYYFPDTNAQAAPKQQPGAEIPYLQINPEVPSAADQYGRPNVGGVLAQPQTAGAPPQQQQEPQPDPVLSQATAGNRYTSPLIQKPDPRIGTNEMLMRVGSAIMGGAANGRTAGMTAGLDAYNNIQQANRESVVDLYNKEQDRLSNERLEKLKQDGKDKGKKTPGDPTAGLNAIVVNDAISRAMPQIDGWSTGLAGVLLSNWPASQAKNVGRLLETVKANAGFDKLQAMRDASPTGGALGQVSERELGFLQSVFGNLEQDQSADQLKYNLQMFQYIYNSIINGVDGHRYTPPAGMDPMVVQELRRIQVEEAAKKNGGAAGVDTFAAADAIVG